MARRAIANPVGGNDVPDFGIGNRVAFGERNRRRKLLAFEVGEIDDALRQTAKVEVCHRGAVDRPAIGDFPRLRTRPTSRPARNDDHALELLGQSLGDLAMVNGRRIETVVVDRDALGHREQFPSQAVLASLWHDMRGTAFDVHFHVGEEFSKPSWNWCIINSSHLLETQSTIQVIRQVLTWLGGSRKCVTGRTRGAEAAGLSLEQAVRATSCSPTRMQVVKT